VSGRYEDTDEVLMVLKQRGFVVSRKSVEAAMSVTGMRCPLDDKDIKELAGHSRLREGNVNRGPTKQGKVLSSRRWRDAVVLARYKLKLPAEGISIEEVQARHDELISVLLSQSDNRPEIDKRSVLGFWRLLVIEARALCHVIALDPAPQMVSYQDLLETVWGYGSRDKLNYLKLYIYYLRGKLEEDPASPRLIINERRKGYYLAV